MPRRFLALLAACSVASAPQAGAQRSSDDSARPRTPISIGNYPNVNGLRINFRDDHLERVNGVNITVWSSREPATGVVKGMALGLPLTDAGSITGFGTGGFGVGASDDLRGIFLAPVGAGAGGRVRGIVIGGVGAGAGDDIDGLFIGGVGAGAGGDARGVLLGGIGGGVGGNLTGIAAGGIGVGSPRLDGGFAALVVGARDARAVVIAPALFKIERDGSFRGVSVSAVNYVRGQVSGLNLGVVNYARSVSGVQVGVINIIADNEAHRFLPLLNWGAR